MSEASPSAASTAPKALAWIEPQFIEGGCLCGGIRYRVDFPEGHDFRKSSGTCQCTQCRRNTSSLFFAYVRVPVTALTWVPPADGTSTTTLRDYSATAGALRGYCARCGGMMYWRREGGDHVSLAVGTIDPLFLFGEGTAEEKAKVKVWGGEGMPDTGFGNVLISGEGAHEWCGNEIKGVTDEMPMLMRGKRVAKD